MGLEHVRSALYCPILGSNVLMFCRSCIALKCKAKVRKWQSSTMYLYNYTYINYIIRYTYMCTYIAAVYCV